MCRILAITTYLGLVLATLLQSTSHGQQIFSFNGQLASGENLVLATLELNDLPADELSDFGALNFTAAGDTLFGFGQGLYYGTFDETNVGSPFTVNLVGGELTSLGSGPDSAFIRDVSQVPSSTNNPNPNSPTLIIRFKTPSGISGISYFDAGTGMSIFSPGSWVFVGDVNLDGTVDFLDISPFISVLSTGDFLAQADCDGNGTVNFLDISPFIAILSGS